MTIELSWYMAAHSRELSIEKSTLNYWWMFYFNPGQAAGYSLVLLVTDRFTETFSLLGTNLVVEVKTLIKLSNTDDRLTVSCSMFYVA